MTNRAAFLIEPGKIEIGPAEMPKYNENDALIKVHYCGICGSDVHFYQYGEPAYPDSIYPHVNGHEFAGEVVEIGKSVKNLKIGDLVSVEPGNTCGECEWCRNGRYNLCPHCQFLSAPYYRGAFQNYVTFPAKLCFKLPNNVSALEGALVEPLAVGLYASVKSGITIGKKAAILGSGCIGLVTMLSLKAMGVDDVTLVDVFDIRLQKAKELGAAHTINARNADPVKAMADIYEYGPDFVFESAGNAATAAQTIQMVKKGGTVVLIGNVAGQTPLNLQLMVDKEVQLQTSFRYRNIFPTALATISSGKLDIKKIVTRIYPFEQTPEAFKAALNEKETIVKAVVEIRDKNDE
jgi:L-iditol 2-dehydrogenase